jgi:hypothetical protein
MSSFSDSSTGCLSQRSFHVPRANWALHRSYDSTDCIATTIDRSRHSPLVLGNAHRSCMVKNWHYSDRCHSTGSPPRSQRQTQYNAHEPEYALHSSMHVIWDQSCLSTKTTTCQIPKHTRESALQQDDFDVLQPTDLNIDAQKPTTEEQSTPWSTPPPSPPSSSAPGPS